MVFFFFSFKFVACTLMSHTFSPIEREFLLGSTVSLEMLHTLRYIIPMYPLPPSLLMYGIQISIITTTTKIQDLL